MAYGSTRTERAHLSLVRGTAASGDEQVQLGASKRLTRFVEEAAGAGLSAEEAIRLALDRALALADAAQLCGDIEAARARLNKAAAAARPRFEAEPSQAARVRHLQAARPTAATDVSEGLAIAVPGRQLGRLRSVAESSLRAEVVDEMIAWEIAATLEGRTMAEWALWTLSRRRAAA